MQNKTGLDSNDNFEQTSSSEQSQPGETKTRVSESRREYLRQYYRKNREKARLYQREYNRVHKRKVRPVTDGSGMYHAREVVRSAFTHSDIIRSSPEKAARIIEMIITGKRHLCSWRCEPSPDTSTAGRAHG